MTRHTIFTKTYQYKHTQPSFYINPQFVSVSAFYSRALQPRRTINKAIAKKEMLSVTISIPSNEKYDGAMVITLPQASKGCFVEIVEQPAMGATGNIQLKIAYTIPPGGIIYFKLKAYSKKVSTNTNTDSNADSNIEILHLINLQSVERVASLMHSKKRIALLISGSDALQLLATGLFNPGTWRLGKSPLGFTVSINPTWELVAIVGILAAAAVSTVAIVALTTIVTLGVLNNYRINIAEFETGSVTVGGEIIEISFPTLVLDLQPE